MEAGLGLALAHVQAKYFSGTLAYVFLYTDGIASYLSESTVCLDPRIYVLYWSCLGGVSSFL